MLDNKNVLRNLRVASPCHVEWDQMSGDERIRFCSACSLHVYNLSEMTSNEISELIVKTEGRLCGRLYRRADGTLITRDCPVGLRAIRQKVSRVASAAFATIISACSFAFGQELKKDQSCKEVPAVTLERKKVEKDQSPALGGTVTDTSGTFIPGAVLTLLNSEGKTIGETATNTEGQFFFPAVQDGTYSLIVTAIGFKQMQLNAITLQANEITTAKLVLNAAAHVLTGLISLPVMPVVETNSRGKTTMSGDLIRKLPIN